MIRALICPLVLILSGPAVAQEVFRAEMAEVYDAEARLDAALLAYPELKTAFRREALDSLETFGDMAQNAYMEHLEIEADWPWNPYFLSNNWTLTYAGEQLVSLRVESSHYTGGAHPNHDVGAIVTTPDALAPLGLEDFLTDVSAESPALTALFYAIYRELMAIKRERLGEGFNETMERETWLAPLAAELNAFPDFALLPNEAGEGAGGLIFYFSPYEVGSYAEGAYEVPVPYSAFADFLQPEWESVFSGVPAVEVLTAPGDPLEPQILADEESE